MYSSVWSWKTKDSAFQRGYNVLQLTIALPLQAYYVCIPVTRFEVWGCRSGSVRWEATTRMVRCGIILSVPVIHLWCNRHIIDYIWDVRVCASYFSYSCSVTDTSHVIFPCSSCFCHIFIVTVILLSDMVCVVLCMLFLIKCYSEHRV